jgi:hypothetical protein
VGEPAYPRPPDKPQDYECCKRGCCPCIFDYYYDALERWETRVRAMGGDPAELLAAQAVKAAGVR